MIFSIKYEIIGQDNWGTYKVEPEVEAQDWDSVAKAFYEMPDHNPKNLADSFERHEIWQITKIR